MSVFFVFLDGNLGDDSEEEGTVMLNLDQVCDEKPVKWVHVLMSSCNSLSNTGSLYASKTDFFSFLTIFVEVRKLNRGKKQSPPKRRKEKLDDYHCLTTVFIVLTLYIYIYFNIKFLLLKKIYFQFLMGNYRHTILDRQNVLVN